MPVHKPALAICGGGNAGHALAVATSRNFEGDIFWLVGSEEKADVLRRGISSDGGLYSTGVIAGKADKVVAVSSDPKAIIPSSDIVMIAVPAFAHAAILKQIDPFVKDGALVGSLPTRSGFEFEATQLLSGIEPEGTRILFGLQTLPWSTRVQQAGKVVNFGALKAKVLMATLPEWHASDLAGVLSQILGTEIVPTKNFLNMTLGNPGQVIHPGLMYGFFAAWGGETYNEDGIPLFYAQASDETGAFIERLSGEIVTVARVVEARSAGAIDLSGVLPIHDWLKISYPTQTADTSTIAACFRTGPLQERKAPMIEGAAGSFAPNFAYRYLSEDVPFGLAVVRAIAQMANVQTPAIDAVLHWAQAKLDKRYLIDGKVNGLDGQALPIPQNAHIETLDDLIDWYTAQGNPAAARESVEAV